MCVVLTLCVSPFRCFIGVCRIVFPATRACKRELSHEHASISHISWLRGITMENYVFTTKRRGWKCRCVCACMCVLVYICACKLHVHIELFGHHFSAGEGRCSFRPLTVNEEHKVSLWWRAFLHHCLLHHVPLGGHGSSVPLSGRV